MKETFRIISDGACDISKEEAARWNVTIVPFYVSFQDKIFVKNMKLRRFYQRLTELPKKRVRMVPPRVSDYVKVFLPLAEAGIPILCLCMDGTVSRSLCHAQIARQQILERLPKAVIEVVDSHADPALHMLFVKEAARLQKDGFSFYGTTARLKRIRGRGKAFFISCKSGYRLKRKRHAVKESLDQLMRYLKKETPKRFSISIGYGYNYGEAANLRSMVLKKLRAQGYPITEKDVPLYRMGRVESLKTGPAPLGVAILKHA